jgi:plastocyanin
MAGRGPGPEAAMPAPASPEAPPIAASRGAEDEAERVQAAPPPAEAPADAFAREAAAEAEAGRHHHEPSHEAAAEKAEEAHDHASEATLRIVEEPAPPSELVPPPPARALPAEEVAARVRPEVERGDAVIAGRVELIQVHPVPAGPGQLQRTWVAFRPNRGRHRAAPMEEQRIITRQSQFQPQALMITAGTTVRFPNYDRIQHNVFSLSEGNRFDVGLYGPGEGVAHTFLNPGLVYVYCNIHPNMAAFLWVVDTPYFAQIDMDGTFRIEGVPRGGGILEVWNHRAELYRFPVVAPDQNVRIALRITKPPVLQHTNKFGRPY